MTKAARERIEAYRRRTQEAEKRRLASLARYALRPAERAMFRELAGVRG